MRNIALLYYSGFGVSVDYKEAAKWHQLAVNAGNVDSIKNLYDIYMSGLGVKRNSKLAESWLAKYEAKLVLLIITKKTICCIKVLNPPKTV